MGSEPKMQNCASATENCMSNKCCMTSGTKCWRISDTTAKCSKLCPGGNCWVEKPGYAFKPAYMTRDNSIFCYAVHAVKKGTGVTGEKDLAILSAQLKNNVGLFSCNDWEVFSDEPAQLSPTISTRVLPANAEYGKFFRKDTPTGVYFQNCKEVLEGFFGNLEVVSAEGFKRFLEQIDTSYTSGCWRQDTEECKKGWKYGTWGEDLFMQRTMDDAEVSKISDFSLTSSGTCPGDRPKDQKKDTKFVPTCTPGETKAAVHPFRDVKSWFKCLGTITGKTYS